MGTTSLLSGETHTCVTFAVNASTPLPINPSTKKVKECSPQPGHANVNNHFVIPRHRSQQLDRHRTHRRQYIKTHHSSKLRHPTYLSSAVQMASTAKCENRGVYTTPAGSQSPNKIVRLTITASGIKSPYSPASGRYR